MIVSPHTTEAPLPELLLPSRLPPFHDVRLGLTGFHRTTTPTEGQTPSPYWPPAEFGHSVSLGAPNSATLADLHGREGWPSRNRLSLRMRLPNRRSSLIRQQADQNQPRGAGGSACPITKSTYSPVLFPSKWCSSYLPETGAAVHGSNSLGPSNSIGSIPIRPTKQ